MFGAPLFRSTKEDHRRRGRTFEGQEHPEVRVGCDKNALLSSRSLKDNGVGCGPQIQVAHMDGVVAGDRQSMRQPWREAFVNEESRALLTEWELALEYGCRGVPQSLVDVLGLEIRVVGQDLFGRHMVSDHPDDRSDGYS